MRVAISENKIVKLRGVLKALKQSHSANLVVLKESS